MPIRLIEPMKQPLGFKIRTEEGTIVELFMTHLIFTDNKTEENVLMADYSGEHVSMLTGKVNRKTGVITQADGPINQEVAEYIKQYPITLLSKEEIEEVAMYG